MTMRIRASASISHITFLSFFLPYRRRGKVKNKEPPKSHANYGGSNTVSAGMSRERKANRHGHP
jgi:hypothetical protein